MSGCHYLSGLFNPKSLVLVGASKRPNALGTRLLAQWLEGGYCGQTFYVNPKYASLQGKKCYRALRDIPQTVDLAVIVTPPHTWSAILSQCAQRGIKFAIILSDSGAPEPSQMACEKNHWRQYARRLGLRLLGPQSLGLMRSPINLNASVMAASCKPGKLALVSQSGALCSAMLDWAGSRDIGCSTVVATARSADIEFADVLDYLAADPQTQGILVYTEGVDGARLFMSSLRAAARIKPVAVVKSGRHKVQRSTQTVSHTGSLVGRDEVFDAALRRAGVIRGRDLGDLFHVASVLGYGYRAQKGELAIVSNGAGPGIMAADKAWDVSLPLARFSAPTLEALRGLGLQVSNPLDLGLQADAALYAQVLSQLLRDSQVGAMLVLLTPRTAVDPSAVAAAVVALAKSSRKPLVACWMGDEAVRAGRALFHQAALPSFRVPENAVKALAYLAEFRHNQGLLMQTPGPSEEVSLPNLSASKQLLAQVLGESRQLLTEVESKALLAAFHIPVVETRVAYSAAQACEIAEQLGYPVVLKVYSTQLTHKSELGGVHLNLGNGQQVAAAFEAIYSAAEHSAPGKIAGVAVQPMQRGAHGRELLIGIVRDAVFGPVISFGFGGLAAELLGETSVGLPPLNHVLAEELIGRTRAEKLLAATRGIPAANRAAVIDVLLRVSDMACELPGIKEMDINPLWVDAHTAVVLDARVVIDQTAAGAVPCAHTAIHPYPLHLKYTQQLADGRSYVIRPIRPEDAELEQQFVNNLSEQAKYFRFMHVFKQITPEMLARFTLIDYEKEMAFVAMVGEGAAREIIGVCRYVTNRDLYSCDFGVVVGDRWQGLGLATKIMNILTAYASQRGFKRMEGDVLSDNHGMLALCRKLGFRIGKSPDDPTLVKVVKTLA